MEDHGGPKYLNKPEQEAMENILELISVGGSQVETAFELTETEKGIIPQIKKQEDEETSQSSKNNEKRRGSRKAQYFCGPTFVFILK